ncbi:MAG: DUF892 family protein [Ferruginibacter sp.]
MANKRLSSAKMSEEDTMPETDVSKEFINFFVDQLEDIYWSEKHLVKVFPKMQKAASEKDLRNIFSDFLATAQLQVERLEQVFELIPETSRAKKCETIDGLSEEANHVIEGTEKGTGIRDTAITMVAQKIKKYQVETYTGLVQLSGKMGNEDIISLLEETLWEEKEGYDQLTALAEGSTDRPLANLSTGTEKNQADEAVAVYESINLTGKNEPK